MKLDVNLNNLGLLTFLLKSHINGSSFLWQIQNSHPQEKGKQHLWEKIKYDVILLRSSAGLLKGYCFLFKLPQPISASREKNFHGSMMR